MNKGAKVNLCVGAGFELKDEKNRKREKEMQKRHTEFCVGDND